MTDDGGVLGNLPRSRPGQRSEKRAEPSGASTAKTSARPKPAAGARPKRSARPTPPTGGDPVRGAIRGVAGLALTGAKVATGVTREVVRRLPRP